MAEGLDKRKPGPANRNDNEEANAPRAGPSTDCLLSFEGRMDERMFALFWWMFLWFLCHASQKRTAGLRLRVLGNDTSLSGQQLSSPTINSSIVNTRTKGGGDGVGPGIRATKRAPLLLPIPGQQVLPLVKKSFAPRSCHSAKTTTRRHHFLSSLGR